jgi:HSP20 family protein
MLGKVRAKNIDGFLNEVFDRMNYVQTLNGRVGCMDVAEDEKNIYIDIDAPNYEAEDIKIDIQDKKMIISGNIEEEKNGRRYKIRERQYNAFSRSILFENNIDENNIAAELENGVLSIVVPKIAKVEVKKKIEIKKN